MALPTKLTLYEALSEARQAWRTAKQQADAYVVLLGSTQDARVVLELIDAMMGVKVRLAAVASTPGLADYARAEYDDPGLDIVADYQTMITALDDVITTAVSSFPVDGSGYLLKEKFNANGSRFNRTFTAAQMAPLLAKVQVLAATMI